MEARSIPFQAYTPKSLMLYAVGKNPTFHSIPLIHHQKKALLRRTAPGSSCSVGNGLLCVLVKDVDLLGVENELNLIAGTGRGPGINTGCH